MENQNKVMVSEEKETKVANSWRRLILLIAAIICMIAILAVGTLAYFTDSETAYNVITTGTIDAVLKETTIDDRGNAIPFPQGGISGVMPGDSMAKKVWVESNGTESVYVRIRVDMKIVPDTLNADYISLGGLNTADWTKVGDYYYYNLPLKSGEKTAPLFETVEFASNMPNAYQECKLDVIVSMEAVQSKNNGATVFDAAGWPEA